MVQQKFDRKYTKTFSIWFGDHPFPIGLFGYNHYYRIIVYRDSSIRTDISQIKTLPRIAKKGKRYPRNDNVILHAGGYTFWCGQALDQWVDDYSSNNCRALSVVA